MDEADRMIRRYAVHHIRWTSGPGSAAESWVYVLEAFTAEDALTQARIEGIAPSRITPTRCPRAGYHLVSAFVWDLTREEGDR